LDGDGATNNNDVWKLAPVDAGQRAIMRLLNDHIDSQLGPAQYTLLMNDDPDKDDELERNLEDALYTLQASLLASGGPYLMGKHFTLADAHVLPFFLRLVVSLKHFKGYEIPKDEFAVLLEWYAICSERDSVKAVSKSDEKIIEVYQKFIDMKYSFGGLNQN
jgi:glutathione S-transferase